MIKDTGEEKELTVIDHINELRQRILISIAAILLIALVAFAFSDKILGFMLLPAGGMHLNAFGLMDGFMIKWQIAFYTGVVVAFPVWAYEIYEYIRPGLFESERKVIFPVLLGGMVLFVIGAAFGFFLLSSMIRVLIQFFPPEVSLLPTADDYISFVIFFLLACGLAFELPTFVVILVQFQVLSYDMMRKHRRTAYFILFAFAEVITPVSDPIVAPLAVMIPLALLFEISILLARRIEAGRRRQQLKAAV